MRENGADSYGHRREKSIESFQLYQQGCLCLPRLNKLPLSKPEHVNILLEIKIKLLIL